MPSNLLSFKVILEFVLYIAYKFCGYVCHMDNIFCSIIQITNLLEAT